MMRWLFLAVMVVALTAGATVALQFLPAGTSSDDGVPFPNATVAEKNGPHGVAEVDENLIHDFGNMAQYSKGKHTWVLKNVGEGDLRLIKGESSCSCTIASLKDGNTATVKPGEETSVELEWDTKDRNGEFGQKAEILTPDDPNRQKLVFVVRGHVAPSIATVPPTSTVPFMNVSNEDSQRYHFAIYSPDMADLVIDSITSSKPDKIMATAEPLTDEERLQLGIQAKGGFRVDVLMEPGMPLGEIHEELVIKTNHSKKPQLRMMVVGKAVGPVTVTPDTVMFTATSSSKPTTHSLTLWVRGEDQTKFEILKWPQSLKVSIEAVDDNTTKVVDPNARAKRYRLVVTVPAGTPPSLIEGTIILKTDHPHAGEVKIPVNVAVKTAG